MSATSVLAHQGGWDEILLVLGPLAFFGAVLFLANKRAAALGEVEDDTDTDLDAT